MAQYIKNGIVKMLWEADKFFEVEGMFVAAVKDYNGVIVVFKDNDAFLLRNESNPDEVADFNEVVRILQMVVSEGYSIREECEDLYIPLYDGSHLDTEALDSYGIGSENAKDIGERVMDLSPYYEVEYVENPDDAF
ncbi:MAG: hypothetical protein IJ421_10955 [Prevotella sp.]|nr:hypothetical protein [Prevotella sp.]